MSSRQRIIGIGVLVWLVVLVASATLRAPPHPLLPLVGLRAIIHSGAPQDVWDWVGRIVPLATAAVGGAALIIGLAVEGGRIITWLAPRLPEGTAGIQAGIIRTLLGWGAAGPLLFGLAACGLFRRMLLIPLALLLVSDVIGQFPRAAAGWRAYATSLAPRGIAAVLAAATVAATLGISFITAFAYPTEIDSLMYHLAIAGRALDTGGLVPMASHEMFHFPAASELLRAWMLVVAGEPSLLLLGPTALALTAGLLVVLLSPRIGSGWGWFAAAAWVTNPLALSIVLSAKPEVLLAPLGLGALMLVQHRPGVARSTAAGLLVGAAAAMKYSAGELALALMLVLLPGVGGVASATSLAAAAALPVLPWITKSWLLTGNPLYPFASSVFGGLDLTPALSAIYAEILHTVTHVAQIGGLHQRLAAPLTLAFTEGSSPLWGAALPFLALPAVWIVLGRRAVVACTIAYVAWAVGPIQLRYLMPVLPFLLAAATTGLASAPRLPAAVIGAAILIIQLGGLPAGLSVGNTLPAGLGLESRTAQFQRLSPLYTEALAQVSRLPSDAVVIYAGVDVLWPLPRRTHATSFLRPFPVYPLLQASGSAPGFRRRLRQLRATHLLYNPPHAMYLRRYAAAFPYTQRHVELWAGYWRSHARELWRSDRVGTVSGMFVLYELASRSLPDPRAMAFLPGLEGLIAQLEDTFQVAGTHEGLRMLRTLEPSLAGFGIYASLKARIWKAEDPPSQAFALLIAAERIGYCDLTLWGDLSEVADRLGRREEAKRARQRLKEISLSK